MLPLGYAVRNLFRDPTRLLQTVLGSAMVVLLVMTAALINTGMTEALSASGSEKNVILLGSGSEDSILRSEIEEKSAGIAESSISGLKTFAGEYAVSPEIHQMTFLAPEKGERHQVFVRGVTSRALLVHRKLVVTDGSFLRPGKIMVGRLAWKKLGLSEKELKPGAIVYLEDMRLTVAGVFSAPGTVLESEIWVDLNDLRSLSLRENLSCVVVRLDDGDIADIDLFTKQRLDLELAALSEQSYYSRIASFYAPIRGMTWLTAILIATGALLGGLNTLYAAFASRIREIATLQAIGYRRPVILFSLVQESMLACVCGAVLAVALAALLLDGIAVSFSIGSIVLRVTPFVASLGFLTGILLGLIGVIPPGLRCLLPPLPDALRSSG